MFVLDTNVLTDYRHGNTAIKARLAVHPTRHVFTTVVTAEEILRGCLADIHRSIRNTNRLIAAYDRLEEMRFYLSEWQVLPFDHAAARTYADLIKRKVRVHTNDLRIAAIALSRDFTVVTANVRHFRNIPALRVDDWAVL